MDGIFLPVQNHKKTVPSQENLMNPTLTAEMSRNWWVLVVYGVAAVLFGIVALMAPLTAAIAIAWAIGFLALVEGITSIVALFNKHIAVSKGWLILYATVSILFGLLTIFNPVVTASMLLIFLAVWLIVAGIYRIIFAIQVRKEIEGEWMIGLSGALAVVLGVLLLLQPFFGLVITAIWIGAFVLVYGLLQIAAGIRMRKLSRVDHPAQPHPTA